jgi:hypothetical protein
VRNSRDTRWASPLCAGICALMALLVAAAPAGAVDPAVKEYSLNFPNARGKSYPGAETPTPRPSELAPAGRRALEQSPNGKALATIATAPELGAPESPDPGNADLEGVGSRETPSVPSALSDTLGDAVVILGILALMGVIGLLAFMARARQTGNTA